MQAHWRATTDNEVHESLAMRVGTSWAFLLRKKVF